MFNYILVPVTGAKMDAPAFAAALSLVRHSPAHLEFLHVRLDVQAVLVAMAAGDPGGGASYDQLLVSLDQDVSGRHRAVETAFREFCKQERIAISEDPSIGLPSAELTIETGDEARWIAEHGRSADLLVVARARDDEPVAMDVLESALMETGRPLLIVPTKAPSRHFSRIAIGWKSRPQAARAVNAALPFIEKADRVIILSVAEGAGTEEESTARLRKALSWHNPNTSVQYLKPEGRDPVDTLLAAAADADLLVMGGYSRSRLREIIFGGFTRRILTGADLPVFMAH
jgi:nucleotide-binding universal stress UspA family protein